MHKLSQPGCVTFFAPFVKDRKKSCFFIDRHASHNMDMEASSEVGILPRGFDHFVWPTSLHLSQSMDLPIFGNFKKFFAHGMRSPRS